MQKITSQKKSPRALVAGAMQIARLLQHPVDASGDEWVAFLCGNPRALVVRHDAVSRSVQFSDKLIAFAKYGASVLAPALRIGRARRARWRMASAT
ncbi:hypothetical protein [Bradyrhizobium sp. WSM1253]|uniref:hypothetical protein n=1 Tax=Bradyrhizobium sp. WSM1253 TaxID=319003 RepID=UPI0012F49DAF|nr:hypothetical protein [Bradyrhizobium sp. WSM1253]